MFLSNIIHRHKNRSYGFTLIEMAIVLGIVGVLSAGLWRMMSVGTQQTKDQTTAQQQVALINAVTGFLADTTPNTGGQAFLETIYANYGNQPGGTATLYLPGNCNGNPPTGIIANYLPSGVSCSTTNSYGQTYTIQVRLDSVVYNNGVATNVPQTYSFMIIASGPVIPDADGGRISSLIGGDGGFIYTAPVCTTAASTTAACGTMGAWQITNVSSAGPAGYGFAGGTYGSGSVASRTYIGAPVAGSNSWLARVAMPSDPNFNYNTMQTNYYTSGVNDLYMYPYASPNTPTGANNIHINNGALMIEGSNANGSIQLGINGSIFGVGGAQSPLGDPLITLSAASNLANYQNGSSESLMVLNTGGCTTLGGAFDVAHCPPVINVPNGDINLSHGQMEAIKILSASDMRLKKNIRPIEDPLANLMKIDAVAFALKDSGAESMGVTAQNLEKTYPQLVSDIGGRKYVEYNGLIGPLIGAVQELKRQNDDLREQLNQQKLREDFLEKQLSAKKNP